MHDDGRPLNEEHAIDKVDGILVYYKNASTLAGKPTIAERGGGGSEHNIAKWGQRITFGDQFGFKRGTRYR